ncbi:MAG TPA: BamA/TamA family outer membrane protein [Gemmatimonadales bacterium]|nr:BamA/TamA family outer membrane protein [Gemmatimonadales bacterium]
MRVRRYVLLVALIAAAPLAAQQKPRVVRGLRIEGNHALDDYTLKSAIATSNSSYLARAWPFRLLGLGEKRPFDELEFRRDVVRLLLLYRQSGYMNAAVDTLVRRDSTGHDVYVTFRITEGEPVRVTRIDLPGLDSLLNEHDLRRDLPLRVGDPFNRFLFQAAADTIAERLRNRGYPYADVLRNFDTDAATLGAQVTLEAVPGPRMRIGAVEIEGLAQMDSTTVRRALSIHPGDVYRQDELFQSQRDLYGLGVFRSAVVELADSTPRSGAGDSTVAVLVQVHEGARHGVRVGAGYGTVDCFRVQAGWTVHDFYGGGRTFDITGRVSKLGAGFPTNGGFRNNLCRALRHDPWSDTLNYTLTATLLQPYFFSPRHTASVGVFGERRSEVEAYTRQAVGATAAITFNARRRIPIGLSYTFSVGRTTADPASYCSVFRLCDAPDQAFLRDKRRFAAVTLTGARSKVNSVLDPSTGSVVQATLEHASRIVGSDPFYEFNRGEMQVQRYYALSRRTVLAWRVQGGTILPQRITLSGQAARFVPPDQRFYAGGPNSVRGYSRNELGPRVYVTDSIEVQGPDTTYRNLRASPTGGNSLFVANVELRFPTPIFPERMRAALFTDVGQVWERGDQLAPVSGVRVTPGVGVRFVTPLGPVRLDAAYNGYPAEPGPLYLLNTTDKSLTLIPGATIRPTLPRGFLRRVVIQFAVGQAF